MAELQLQLDMTDVEDVMSILHRQAALLKQCREAFTKIDIEDDFDLMFETVEDLDNYFKEYDQ